MMSGQPPGRIFVTFCYKQKNLMWTSWLNLVYTVHCISYHQLDEEDDWKARLLNELIDTREEKLNLDEFNENEIGDLITFICTS